MSDGTSANLEASIISKSSRASSGQNFMKDLDKLNEQQTVMTLKVSKEKKRKVKLEEDMKVQQRIRLYALVLESYVFNYYFLPSHRTTMIKSNHFSCRQVTAIL